MNWLTVLALGIVIGVAQQSSAISNSRVKKILTEERQSKEAARKRVVRNSPRDDYVYSDEYHDYTAMLSGLSYNMRRVYDQSGASEFLYGVTSHDVTYDEFIIDAFGIDFGNNTFTNELAWDLSEVRTLGDMTELIANFFHEHVSESRLENILQAIKDFKDPYLDISRKFRDLYKEIYRWAKKVNVRKNVPEEHTRGDEMIDLMLKVEQFVTYTDNTLENTSIHQMVFANSRCLSFKECLFSTLGSGDAWAWWLRIQKMLALIQSKDLKLEVVALSRKLNQMLDILDMYGKFDIEDTYYYA